MPGSRTLALLEDGTPVGLGTIRRCRQGCRIGPIYAPDRGGGRAALRGLAATVPGVEIYLDVPGRNAAAMALVEELGLGQRFETARLQRVFGITSFELG